jgi:hypothetical protein
VLDRQTLPCNRLFEFAQFVIASGDGVQDSRVFILAEFRRRRVKKLDRVSRPTNSGKRAQRISLFRSRRRSLGNSLGEHRINLRQRAMPRGRINKESRNRELGLYAARRYARNNPPSRSVVLTSRLRTTSVANGPFNKTLHTDSCVTSILRYNTKPHKPVNLTVRQEEAQ